MIPVFYRPEQSCDEAIRVSPSAGKPALVMADWTSDPSISNHIEVKSFEPASKESLYAAHSKAYVDDVLSCREINGFGNHSQHIAASLRFTTGSMSSTSHRASGLVQRILLQRDGGQVAPVAVALSDTSLMRELSAAQCDQLTARMCQRQLAPGELLFCQGDPGDMLYVLTQGSISIVDSRSPASQRYFSFSPGVMFGEISMLDGGRRSADARADSEVVVWSLSGDAYRALVAADPVLGVQLATNMAVHLAERLRSATSAWRASVA